MLEKKGDPAILDMFAAISLGDKEKRGGDGLREGNVKKTTTSIPPAPANGVAEQGDNRSGRFDWPNRRVGRKKRDRGGQRPERGRRRSLAGK